MKILLFGKNGQVGWALQRSLAPLGEVVALGRGDFCGDFTQPEELAERVRNVKPDVIVNAAAYTAVDRAESEPDLAHAVNAAAPAVLAREAAQLNALLVHYSTDYVFDGSGEQPRTEEDATGPLSVYGRSKLAGEEAIRASCCRHLIFRTSWVYALRGGNFAKTMLRLAKEKERLRVVKDQIGAPTSADLLADITAHTLQFTRAQLRLQGTYHLAAQDETSWHGYAMFVVDTARRLGMELAVREIVGVPTSEYPTPAQRPLNSRLSCDKLQRAFGLRLPPWQSGVERMLTELIELAQHSNTEQSS